MSRNVGDVFGDDSLTITRHFSCRRGRSLTVDRWRHITNSLRRTRFSNQHGLRRRRMNASAWRARHKQHQANMFRRATRDARHSCGRCLFARIALARRTHGTKIARRIECFNASGRLARKPQRAPSRRSLSRHHLTQRRGDIIRAELWRNGRTFLACYGVDGRSKGMLWWRCSFSTRIMANIRKTNAKGVGKPPA